MEAVISSVIASLVGGALSKSKKIGVAAISGAYEGLRKAVVKELGGKSGAVQALEDQPESTKAQEMLAEMISEQKLTQSQLAELKALADSVESAVSEAKSKGALKGGDINFGDVRGKVNATVARLKAAGSIKFGSVEAGEGSAVVSDLEAGNSSKASGK